jgi:hypothetical protein
LLLASFDEDQGDLTMAKATVHFERVPIEVVIKIAQVEGEQNGSGDAGRKVRKKKAGGKRAGKRAAGKKSGRR